MRTILLALVVATTAACSSTDQGPPAQVAGDYTLTVTDNQNGCNVENFTTGATQSGITVSITQNGSSLSATGTGSMGLMLAFATGDTLNGYIDGQAASLSSTVGHTQGGCAYSTTATVNLVFSGNQFEGNVLYTDSGNGSPDCGVMQQCTSSQKVTGSR
ncbi:MAG TPA: hypothetical protein VMI75_22500 [Polyangiaceae bacterium]|nr:hypothetical protein [Polyangiaceae bacterium]